MSCIYLRQNHFAERIILLEVLFCKYSLVSEVRTVGTLGALVECKLRPITGFEPPLGYRINNYTSTIFAPFRYTIMVEVYDHLFGGE